ncbi:hypothetical protein [Dysgonomonas sp. 25]|uniref:hypothetical protein n=1 Tax=Dysgonomonas sp. 25 TaxID=2302933 RepID=UPI0013D840EB|nr:hypothetical protein [Dysgonomonas sp. 25]NDV68207.1 hypothetical protein [Dysgonomonas sp. 25]
MGKETVYRRLRGDIHFTFSEACIIASKLGVSLDSLANIKKLEKPIFELELSPNNPVDYLYFKIAQHEMSYEYFTKTPNIVEESIFNNIPYSMLFPHKELFSFRIFKMLYQLDNKSFTQTFESFSIPEVIDKKREKLLHSQFHTPKHSWILNRNLFLSFLRDINYFWRLKLVSDEKKMLMKKELRELLLFFEDIATYGLKKYNVEAWIYLCNIDTTANYTYMKGENFERAYMDGIYMMDTISSSDPLICKFHRDWIESVKRFSTLISVGGEMDRKNFFEEQKELINEL